MNNDPTDIETKLLGGPFCWILLGMPEQRESRQVKPYDLKFIQLQAETTDRKQRALTVDVLCSGIEYLINIYRAQYSS